MSMIHERRLVTLDPARLDTSPDAPYRFRYRLPGEEGESGEDRLLTESIGLGGVIEPPLLLGIPEDSPGMLVVLRGFRRIAAARAAGLDRIQVLLLPDTSLEMHEIMRIIFIEDSAAAGRRSDFDQAYELVRFVRFKGRSIEEFKKYVQEYHKDRRDLFPPLDKVLDYPGQYLVELASLFDLPEATIEAWRGGIVTHGDLLEFKRHGTIDTIEAVSLLADEDLNGHQRQRAVSLMLTIADQGKDRWREFYEDRRSGGGGLLQALRKACYPSMIRDITEAKRIVKEMRLPPGVTISPPENMEGSRYRFAMTIRNEEKLAETIAKLSAALADGKIEKLLDILKGRVQGDA